MCVLLSYADVVIKAESRLTLVIISLDIIKVKGHAISNPILILFLYLHTTITVFLLL